MLDDESQAIIASTIKRADASCIFRDVAVQDDRLVAGTKLGEQVGVDEKEFDAALGHVHVGDSA